MKRRASRQVRKRENTDNVEKKAGYSIRPPKIGTPKESMRFDEYSYGNGSLKVSR